MTAQTLWCVALAALGFGFPRAAPLILALSGATPMAAALVFGEDTAVPTFDFVAIAVLARFALDALASRRGHRRDVPVPGLFTLWIFIGWCVVVTLVAPFLFRDLEVLTSRGELRVLGGPENMSLSSFAQIGYLGIGVLVVALVARARTSGPWVVGLVLGAITLLSAWRLLYLDFGFPFPEGAFDGSPAFGYVDGAPGGIRRFRGILAEPALLGTISVATVAYGLARLTRGSVRARVGWSAIIATALLNGFNALSTTFVLSALALITAAVGLPLARLVVLRMPTAVPVAVILSLVAGAMYFLLPVVLQFTSASVSEKVSSSSYDERSSFDAHAWDLLRETFGFGVGLGVNRASSFVANLSAAAGVLGVSLFVLAVGTIWVRSLRSAEALPVRWVLFSLLVSKLLSGPDLSDSSGLTWLCLGVLAHAYLAARQSASSSRLDAGGELDRGKSLPLNAARSRAPSFD